MATWFDEAYYLKAKLAQLKAVGEKDGNGNDYTLTTLKKAIADNGMTPEEHYNAYGRSEGVNPNAYFNEAEYLQAKLEQLHSVNETDAHGNPYTLTTLKEAIANIGLTPAEHYELYGSHETNKDGTLINPSNAFDANAYAAAKLHQLQHGTAEERAAWADKTPADVMDAIRDAGMSPVTHYMTYGAAEANAGKVPMVQTVPSEQRVANDPHRDDFGQNVPSNYNAPTPAPSEADAAPVTKPADMGGMASTDVSPQVVSPDKPVAVPGDKGYVTPPAGTVDTNDHPVVPVVDPGSGQLVVPTEPTTPPSPPTPPSPTPDTTAPNPPTFDDTLAGDNVIDMGEAHNNVLLTGTAEAGSMVKITVILTPPLQEETYTKTLDTVKAGADGTFSITLSPENITEFRKDGTLTLSATATDAAGNTSEAATKTIKLDTAADLTVKDALVNEAQFGYKAPTALEGATLGDPFDPTADGIFSELRKVWNEGASKEDTSFKDITAEFIAKNASSVDKLVHFSSDGNINATSISKVNGTYVNLSAENVYGGGLALTLDDLNTAIHTAMNGYTSGSQYQRAFNALMEVLGKAYFDVPTITATADDVVNLEVNKVGSIHSGALTADMLKNDLTFSSLAKLVSEVKPIAVKANAERLDIHLADDGDADIVNLMEVRGSVTDITFSGTKGLFGLNIDARGTADTATSGTVNNIDASSLTDAGSGVYINTAPIGISINLGDEDGTISKGINATVADELTFTGSAGDDILVMSQDKYGHATKLDGGKNNAAGDTLAVLVDSQEFDKVIEITASDKMTGFENVAFVSFGIKAPEEGSEVSTPTYQQFSADASSFAAKGVTNFITSNDLKLTNYGGQTVTVVGGLDDEVKIDLAATSATAATINLTMTSNFLSTVLNSENPLQPDMEGRATLTNAENISGLTLTGADANAILLLTDAALDDLAGHTINASGYLGDIQYASEWTYNSTSNTLTKSGSTVTLSGVQTGTAITGEDASA